MIIKAIGRLPVRAHATDAGADLAAGHDVTIPAGGQALVGTGPVIRPCNFPGCRCAQGVRETGEGQ